MTLASSGEAAPAGRPGVRAELGRAAELAALCGFVIVQPVLDLFGRNPDVFLFRGASARTVVAFGLVVTFVPVLVLAGIAATTNRFGARARFATQIGLIGVGFALLTLEVLDAVADPPVGLSAAVAVIVGVLAGLARTHAAVFATWLRYASPAPLLFLALFLFASPTASLVWGGNPEAVAVAVDGDLPPVVMIVFDEIPTASLLGTDGKVDAALFPAFARLAATSTWYREYTTNSNQTWHAVPAMLTGKFPEKNTSPVARFHPHNLFTLLGGVYDVRAEESITGLCPPSVCAAPAGTSLHGLGGVLDDAASVLRDKLTPGKSRAQASASLVEETEARAAADAAHFDPHIDFGEAFANTPKRFEHFVAGMGASATRDRPFDFLHILLPHEPWRFYPSGIEYKVPPDGVGRVAGGDTWEDSVRATELGRQRHLLQLQYTDRLLGVVLDRLQQTGALDRTLVIVTADHGIGFRPGKPARALDKGSLDPSTLPELAYAPLFIKAPGQIAATLDRSDVQLVDILPTLADLVGVKIPWEVDGRSALAPDVPRDRIMIKSTSGAYGPTLEPPLAFDPQKWSPLVDQYAAGRLVGDPADGLAVYRVGKYGALVGASLDRVDVAADPAPRAARIDDAARFASVDPASGSLPGLVTGALDAGPAATVAIVLNGRVAAVSETFTDRGRADAFAAVLPDSMFRKGRNEISEYLVTGDPAAPTLRRAG